jgi:hypothetical protein
MRNAGGCLENFDFNCKEFYNQSKSFEQTDKYLTSDRLIRMWNNISEKDKKHYYDLEMKSTLNIGRPDILYIC